MILVLKGVGMHTLFFGTYGGDNVFQFVDNGIEFLFCDSFQLMAASLNLTLNELKFTRNAFSRDELFILARRKGVFPYDYVNSRSVLQENPVSTIDEFYSKLKAEHISFEDYGHAKTVWNSFNFSRIGEYPDLYMTFLRVFAISV